MERRRQRLTIEITPDEERFIRQIRATAILQGQTLREWVIQALREKLERDRQ